LPYVLDASIAACWCYHDEADVRADIAYELLATDRAIVPLHWWFELRNVLLTGERRKRVAEQHTTRFLAQLVRLPIDFAPLPSGTDVILLARKHGLSFYDAAYLELAKRENISLATLDSRLANAAMAEGVALVGVS
jgi:predicted nucleic acid-binding protein